MENNTPHIVVLGAGFGGLTFCQTFRNPRARVTLIDRQNHHLFQPLLYQVATAGLSAPEIAQPARSILRHLPNVSVRLDEVNGIDLAGRCVQLASGPLKYDHLVIALGGVTSYFGHPEWEEFAPGLKSLDDALRIRREVLLAFERAENEANRAKHEPLLTIVVVGGGATGLELAGAFAELTRHVLRSDFRHIDPSQARVILLEGGDRLLAHMAPELSDSAKQQLETMGVEVRLQAKVSSISDGLVELADGTRIEAANIIWAAGVSASPLTRSLGIETDRSGRLKVLPDLSLPGHSEVFAIGDLALVLQADGKPVPGVSPAAIQEAQHVSKLISDELAASTPVGMPRPAFKYWDKGTMATIGRSAAVAEIGNIRFSGFIAWLAWLFVHLIFLVGFRNKLAVLLQWFYSYCTYRRGARIVTGIKPSHPESI